MNSPFRRRLLIITAALAALGVSSLTLAGAAGAAVPQDWEQPKSVDPLHAVLILGGIPLLIAVVIAVLVYLPSMIRGESLSPGSTTPESQWLGGPSKETGELAAPDGADSSAGGASGRW